MVSKILKKPLQHKKSFFLLGPRGTRKTYWIKQNLPDYVTAYLREEVMQEGRTRNLSTFTRFLEVASFLQGQVVNISATARETNTNQKNITNYLEMSK